MIKNERRDLFSVAVLWVICMGIASGVTARLARAESYGESDLQAAQMTGEKVLGWLVGLQEKPGSISIFQVRPSAPLTSEYSSLVESEILRAAQARHEIRISMCLECRNPQVKIEGDSLVVSKGMPDAEALKALGRKTGANAFLVVDLFRTTFSVMAEATLYRASSGDVIAVEQFKVPSFELANSSLMFMLQGGPGKVIGPKSETDSIPFSFSFSALEELGFGKGGLAAGAIMAGPNGNMGYLTPTVGLRSRFGATPVYALASLGAGFAMTGSKAGAAFRGSYDVFIGTFTLVGLDAVYLVPVNGMLSGSDGTLNGYVGLHLGIALGR